MSGLRREKECKLLMRDRQANHHYIDGFGVGANGERKSDHTVNLNFHSFTSTGHFFAPRPKYRQKLCNSSSKKKETHKMSFLPLNQTWLRSQTSSPLRLNVCKVPVAHHRCTSARTGWALIAHILHMNISYSFAYDYRARVGSLPRAVSTAGNWHFPLRRLRGDFCKEREWVKRNTVHCQLSVAICLSSEGLKKGFIFDTRRLKNWLARVEIEIGKV